LKQYPKFHNHKELQRIGIERAKLEGKYIGRRPESKDTPEKFLAKKKSQDILILLREGLSYSTIEKRLKCSTTTVTKVARIYQEHTCVELPKWNKSDREEIDLRIPNWMLEI
jgi:DNA invertase Pin-like site-specific DNA recombinase